MAGEQTIDQLNIEINAEAKKSSSGLDKLVSSIERLQEATGGGVGQLTGIAASISKLSAGLSGMKSQSGIVSSLANSIGKLNSVKTNNISGSISTLTASLKTLGGMDPTLKTLIADLATLAKSGTGGVSGNALTLEAAAAKAQAVIDQSALKSAKAQEGLQAIADKNKAIEDSARAAAQQEQQLTGSINAVIQEHVAQYGSAGAFSNKAADLGAVMPDYGTETSAWPKNAPSEINVASINALKSAMGGVGSAASSAMSEVSSGSSRAASFMDKLKQSVSDAKDKLSGLGTSSNSFFSMGRFYGWYFILRQIASVFGGFINNINSYIENVNLFDVAMGSAAQSGEKLANSLQSVLGVDSGEAVRYMGVFQELGSSFGIANKQATTMSENMTQLGYDLASFYNINTGTAFEKLESVYTGQSRAARSLGIDISNARLQQELYNLGIKEKVNDLTQADKAELRYIAIMKQTTNAQGDMARTIQTPANALRVLQAQLSITGRAIGSIFIPALEAILPVVTAVIEVIGDLASELASLVGFKMPKIDYSSLQDITNGADDASNAVGGIGDSASKSKKQLDNLISGFDELNILQTSSDEDQNGSGAGNNGNILSGIDLPQYDALKNAISNQIDDLKNKIKSTLADIAAIVSGALLAVGAILVLTGANIPLGLGLMALGAVGLAADIAANWDTMTTPLLNTLTTITAGVGGFLLALGAIMTFSGANIPLGLGLMAAGAVSLATAVAIDWNSPKTQISTVLSGLTGLISGAALAVGGMLTFTGANVPLGLGLMAVGAVGLASVVALNWNSMDAQTKETLSTITATVGGSMLAVGALLTLSGASPILGISMMAVGAGTLAETLAVNWDSMSKQLRETLTDVTSTVGGFSLALGAALTFSGANLPLGISLLVIGAGSLAATAALDWDKTNGNINDALSKITAITGASSLALGAALALSGANLPLGIALLGVGAASLVSSAMLDWENMSRQTKGTLSQITVIVSGSMLGIGAMLALSGVNLPLGIALISAGAATLIAAAVINWDTIKNQVKAILADILSIISGMSVAVGVMLCLTGAGIPLGLGMILAGAAGVWKAHEISSTPITDFVRNMMNGIIEIIEKGVNWCIEKLNTLSWTVPDWVPKIGGNKWGFDISEIHIPRLASGDVAYSSTLAEIGEYPSASTNPEIVAPQSIIRETVDESNGNVVAVLSKILEVAQKIAEKDTTVNLDGKKISENTNKHNAGKGYNLGLQST